MEQSIQQLEQVPASIKLNVEHEKSNVRIVASQSADGQPVKAVVDSGAQSTIISHSLLHQVADNMQKKGCHCLNWHS